MGAWIETTEWRFITKYPWSHPTWVRGLKPRYTGFKYRKNIVAPYVGAWIETLLGGAVNNLLAVAPYVGAWIETGISTAAGAAAGSHPTWVRGLKLLMFQRFCPVSRRTLRGCVD